MPKSEEKSPLLFYSPTSHKLHRGNYLNNHIISALISSNLSFKHSHVVQMIRVEFTEMNYEVTSSLYVFENILFRVTRTNHSKAMSF